MVLFIRNVFLVLFVGFFINVQAQTSKVIQNEDVPYFVRKTLVDLYPNVSELEWIEISGNYIAKVKSGDSFGRVNITGGGSFMSSEWDMDIKFIPSSINEYLSKNYPKFKPVKIFVERKAQSTYVLEIFQKKGKNTKILVFSILGEFLEERK